MLVGFIAMSQAAADHVWTLIQLNRESQQCFRAAGDGVDDAELTALFYRLARQRAAFAEQLGEYVAPHAIEEPSEDAARRPAALQRWWQALRQKLTADEVSFALRLAERAEDEVLAAYDVAQAEPVSPEIARLLQSQRGEVASAHQQIRALHKLWSMRRAG